MSLLAFVLVLLSAFCHATWNLLAKGVPSGAPFVWLFDTVSLIIYAPFAVWVMVTRPLPLSWLQLLAITGGSLLHFGCFLSLLAYILVLSALVSPPISYVAPAREVSILIAAISGSSVLKEGEVKRRLVAASLIVVGVVMLALG